MRSVRVKAPGKLVILGEYAVLSPGGPAIVMAVNRYLQVRLRPSGDGRIRLSGQLTRHLRRTLTTESARVDTRDPAMRLFGADLAREHDTVHADRTPETAARDLEPLIDRYQEQLPPLDRFILRMGAPAAASLHLACTVVRRAERDTVRLARHRTIHPPALQYLNRLSDLLVVLARVVNLRSHVEETAYRHSARVFR